MRGPTIPTFAGQGTVLLPGIEVVWKGEHVLRARRRPEVPRHPHRDAARHRRAGTHAWRARPGQRARAHRDLSRRHHDMCPRQVQGTAGVRAIELVDGAPKGLGQTRARARTHRPLRRQPEPRARRGQRSSRLGAHRFGVDAALRSAAGGTPRPTSCQRRHREHRPPRRRDPRASSSATSRIPNRASQLVLTAPLVAWGMLRTLSTDERVVWLAWAVALTLVARLLAWRRPRADGAP